MKSVFVCVSPHFFELNQNGYNLANFEARTSRFCMVVDLEDEDRLRRTTAMRTTTTFNADNNILLLSEAKQTPAEQLALLSRASGVQF